MMRARHAITLDDIHSLTDFLRNHKSYVRRLNRNARPMVLTVNGEAKLVIQDTRSYQMFLDTLDRAEAIQAIHRGLKAMRRGERKPAADVFKRLQKKSKIRTARVLDKKRGLKRRK